VAALLVPTRVMSTPRYLGSTVAAAKTYVQSTLTTGPFLAIFDMDRDGAVTGDDETAFAAAVERAETEVDEILGASHGAPFTLSTLATATQNAIMQCVAETLPWHSVKFRASMADEKKAPYRTLWKDACERLKRIASDAGRRLPSAGASQPTPRAGVLASDDGDTGATWQNIANGTISL